MDLKQMRVDMKNQIHSVKDTDYWNALVNAAVNLWVPQAMVLYICTYM